MTSLRNKMNELLPERRQKIEERARKLIEEEEAARKTHEFFHSVREEWLQERSRGADVAGMVAHPAYQRIIEMGQDAVPLILQELQKRPDHWFPALYAITGANPVPVNAQGNLSMMTDAWLNWGRAIGYRWQQTWVDVEFPGLDYTVTSESDKDYNSISCMHKSHSKRSNIRAWKPACLK